MIEVFLFLVPITQARYSHLSNKRGGWNKINKLGGWNKQGKGAKVVKSIIKSKRRGYFCKKLIKVNLRKQ